MARVRTKLVKPKVGKLTIKQPVKGVKTTVKYTKTGAVKNIKSDFTRRAIKSQRMSSKAKLTEKALELEKVKSNNAAKVAIAGEAGATVTGTVGTGIGYQSVNQQVNGGMTSQGGLGRDEANTNNNSNTNNSTNEDDDSGMSWEDIIGSLGKTRG